ncbi:MAG: hypothetical protein ACLR6B_15560 [Blautia sp.]
MWSVFISTFILPSLPSGLYLAMAKADQEGKAMRPSYVVGRLREALPGADGDRRRSEDQSFKSESGRLRNGLSCLTEGLLKAERRGVFTGISGTLSLVPEGSEMERKS